LKSGIVEHHNLPINPGPGHPQPGDGIGDPLKSVRPVIAVAREKPDFVALNPGEDPVAVKFGLDDPVAFGDRRHQGGELRLQLRGHAGLARNGQR
jgi:hypothetical protein